MITLTPWPVISKYNQEHLREIMMPIGGIGTGFFGLGGRGQLTDWQMMSRPNRGWRPSYAHLLLRTEQDETVKLHVLEMDHTENLAADFGAPGTLLGIPRFAHAEFEASYPFGRVILSDPDIPLTAVLEAFNPLIPHDTDASSLPFGLLSITLSNHSDKSVTPALTLLLTNFVGTDGIIRQMGHNTSNYLEAGGMKGLMFASQSQNHTARNGTLTALWSEPDVRIARRWAFQDKPWNGEQLAIIDQLLKQGWLEDAESGAECEPSPEGRTWHSSASTLLPAILPGSSHTVHLLIAWHFPWRNQEEEQWWSPAEGISPMLQNWYATQFADARDVAEKVIPALPDLRKRTIDFVSTVAAHPAPHALREAALFNLTPLRTHTCFRTGDGKFFAWEGCGGEAGCCIGTCTHVWNYENATLDLFPDLHRSMLETHMDYGVVEDGGQRFRISLPLVNQTWQGAAADGQMGMIVRAYGQMLADGEEAGTAWIKKHYPVIKKMLEFAWVPGGWDADKDGVMEGSQHNTYDVEFIGPNPMCNVWYLAALEAMGHMAEKMGDADFAAECRKLRAQGTEWTDSHLYNGRYYIQHIEAQPPQPAPMTSLSGLTSGAHPILQMGNGCLIDQLVGQYKANRYGLVPLLDLHHIHTTALSIFKYNHLPNMRDHYNNMRTFAIGSEAGTVICSYPDGNRPEIPFPYWGECMTGYEYQLAILLLDCGRKKEAEAVAAAVRHRHNGRNRNPFNEPECGSYYARCMAAWGLLKAWEKPHLPQA